MKDRIERRAVQLHFGENVIRRTVENAGNGIYLIVGQFVYKRTYHGNSAPDCRLKEVSDAVMPRQVEQLVTESGNDRFVGCDHRLSRFYALARKIRRRVNAAHHFGNDADLRVVAYHRKVVNYAITERTVGKIAEVKYIFDPHRITESCGNDFFVFCNYLGASGAYRSEAEQSNIDHFLRSFSV